MKKTLRILAKILLVIVLPIVVICMTINYQLPILTKIALLLGIILQSIAWAALMNKTKMIPALDFKTWKGIGFGAGFENSGKQFLVILPFIILELQW